MELNSIAIVCECIPCHDWMSFVSWYSLRKRLPDCPVEIETRITHQIFAWAPRVGVRIVRKSEASLRIPPTVVAVRDFEGDASISSSKSKDQTYFVDYSSGCGDFVVDKWINTTDVPFYRALKRFGSYKELTVNEVAVLELWEKCHHVYRTMGGL